jgi:hypothetical protein
MVTAAPMARAVDSRRFGDARVTDEVPLSLIDSRMVTDGIPAIG